MPNYKLTIITTQGNKSYGPIEAFDTIEATKMGKQWCQREFGMTNNDILNVRPFNMDKPDRGGGAGN